MYHLTQSKNGVSALELMRRLGVSYNTAWMLKQKLMQVMKDREAGKTLTDRVEMDDALHRVVSARENQVVVLREKHLLLPQYRPIMRVTLKQ